VVENTEELRRTVNFRRVWSEYDGINYRLSKGRYRRNSVDPDAKPRARFLAYTGPRRYLGDRAENAPLRSSPGR
jgi:hypothetical protein